MSAESSTFQNTALAVSFEPAIEFDVFPYSEATRRLLTLQYAVGPRFVRYEEETIFEKERETLLRHALAVTLDRREKWGTSRLRVGTSQLLNDPSKYRVEAAADASIRIAGGLSFIVELEAARLRDQLYLPRRGATTEEILLRQRQLASSYQYDVMVGITFRFGSLYNNVVNPRFGS